MSAWQKQAWFLLAVVLLTMVVVGALIPVLGFKRAQGGLGVAGLAGLAPLFLLRGKKKTGEVAYDERDALIQSRSWLIAYSVFWLVFVLVCVSAPYTVGSSGTVPVHLVQVSVFYAMIFVLGVHSIATLLQYRMGGSDGAE
jgi:hypothetical protein